MILYCKCIAFDNQLESRASNFWLKGMSHIHPHRHIFDPNPDRDPHLLICFVSKDQGHRNISHGNVKSSTHHFTAASDFRYVNIPFSGVLIKGIMSIIRDLRTFKLYFLGTIFLFKYSFVRKVWGITFFRICRSLLPSLCCMDLI